MSIQNDDRERQEGADPPDACEPLTEAPTQTPAARPERGRSPFTRTNGQLTDRGAGPPAPAELSRYRAGRARGRAGESEHIQTAVGLPLILTRSGPSYAMNSESCAAS